MKRYLILCLIAVMLATMCSCAANQQQPTQAQLNSTESTEVSQQTAPTQAQAEQKELCGLKYEKSMDLVYAEQFQIDYYEGGYKHITVGDGNQYLIVPEGKSKPDGLDESIQCLQQPMNRIYLAATSAMALFDSIDALDSIKFSGTNADGWYIQNAVTAMENGKIVYAGKYSAPDYEMLVSSGCSVAIESTMILHSPKVQEMLIKLGIPVFIDRSSYETHPLGRTEWVKLYAAMINKEQEAEAFFNKQSSVIEELKDFENTEKKVVYFSLNTSGSVVVRSATDYIASMIEIAGGRYAFSYLKDETSAMTTVTMTMEEFYVTAVDADYLIYNAAIENEIKTVNELTAQDKLFNDFKAVKNGNVYCSAKSLYQQTDVVGTFIHDLHLMLLDQQEGMTFLTKLN